MPAAGAIQFHKTAFKSWNPNAIIKSRFWACYCAMFQLELNECCVILYNSLLVWIRKWNSLCFKNAPLFLSTHAHKYHKANQNAGLIMDYGHTSPQPLLFTDTKIANGNGNYQHASVNIWETGDIVNQGMVIVFPIGGASKHSSDILSGTNSTQFGLFTLVRSENGLLMALWFSTGSLIIDMAI